MTLTSSVTTKGQVTIPLFIRKSLGIKAKVKVVFIKRKDKVYLRPAVDFLDLAGSVVTKRSFNISAMKKAAKNLVKKRHGQSR